MYSPYYSPDDFPKYRYEMTLIERGDEYSKTHSDKSYDYYRRAMESIKKKQEEVGEGKDMKLDFLRTYSVYAMARAPPHNGRRTVITQN
jgi:hypothetical protein